ncbi:MAG: hypothetical protein J6J45_04030 [Clostridia bacterium]|nr:hypothetical protein [Clostridia bacterium]
MIKVFFFVFVFIVCTTSCSTRSSNTITESNETEYSFSLKNGDLFEGKYLYENIPRPASKETIYVSFDSNKERSHYSFRVENINLQETQNYIYTLEKRGISREVFNVFDKNDYPILNYKGITNDNTIITISQSDSIAVIGITVTNK